MRKTTEIMLLIILFAGANAIGFYVYSDATFSGGVLGRNFGNFVAAMIGVFLSLPVGFLVGIIPKNSFLNKCLKVLAAMFLNGFIPTLFLRGEIESVGFYKVSSAMWIWVLFETFIAGTIVLMVSYFAAHLTLNKINPREF